MKCDVKLPNIKESAEAAALFDTESIRWHKHPTAGYTFLQHESQQLFDFPEDVKFIYVTIVNDENKVICNLLPRYMKNSIFPRQ